MSDNNKSQESIVDDGMSVSPISGYALRSAAVAPRRPEAMNFFPFIQYPIDDTMPVEAWVFELPPPAAQDPFKPLRPEVEQAAFAAINRHLPPSERIETTRPSHTSTKVVPYSRPRRYHDNYLPPPPRSWYRLDRQEAARPASLPQRSNPAQGAEKKATRRVKSMNWTETENQEKELAWRAELERHGPVAIVPDLKVTRPDGETRHLQDPNLYVQGIERRNGGYFW